MANIDLSAKHENNLRRESGVGIMTFCAEVGDTGARLTSTIQYANATDHYIGYCIPKDAIVTKIYMIIDEAFDTGTTCTITTIVDKTAVFAALTSLATAGKFVSATVDTYFDDVDGFDILLSQAVTKGKLRLVAEFIDMSTSDGSYIDLGA